jgi:hypothetical protein
MIYVYSFILLLHFHRYYEHTIHSSFPATCFGSLSHFQELYLFFLHLPVFVCIGHCLHFFLLVSVKEVKYLMMALGKAVPVLN